MAKALSTRVPYKGLDALVQQMKGGLFTRHMRAAQKKTLLEWRDRIQPPGLAARFTPAGKGFYQFAKRLSKKILPAFVKTGSLKSLLAKRRPRSLNNRGNDVVTVFKYGGGALNFLTKIGGVISKQPVVSRASITVSAHMRRGRIRVRTYRQSKIVKSKRFIMAQRTYAQEFGAFLQDRKWIIARVAKLFKESVLRSSLDKKGRLKSSVLEGA